MRSLVPTHIRFIRELSLLALLACMAGCMSAQVYEGERRPADELARISGDPRITAGSPVTVILRQVDGYTLNVGQSSVDVLAGEHELLVDCRIAETGQTSRHTLEVQVSEGRRYRLRAETGPGLRECTEVTLEAVD